MKNIIKFFTIIIIVVIAFPTLQIFSKLFENNNSYLVFLKDYIIGEYIYNTLFLVFFSSITCLSLGIYFAWINVIYDYKFKKLIELLLIIPLAIPIYIQSYIYSGLFDFDGWIDVFLSFVFRQNIHINIMSRTGLVVVYTSVLYPVIYLLAKSSFSMQSGDVYDASKLLNKSLFNSFYKIFLPLSRPAIFSALVLVIVEILNDYGAVKYYGINTFITGVFESWFTYGDFNSSTFLSALILVFILFIILVELRSRNKQNYNSSSNSNKTNLIPLKFLSRNIFFSIFGVTIFFSLILPISQVIYWLIINIHDTFPSNFIQVCINSFTVSLIILIVLLLVSTLILLGNFYTRSKLIKYLKSITFIGYAMPGSILALSLLMTFINTMEFFELEWQRYLTTSILMLLIGFFIRFWGVIQNVLVSNLEKISYSQIESAKILKKKFYSIYKDILLKEMRPAIISASILLFVETLKELPLTLLLRPFNFDTLSTAVFQLASDEMVDKSSPFILIIILFSMLPIVIANRFSDK